VSMPRTISSAVKVNNAARLPGWSAVRSCAERPCEPDHRVVAPTDIDGYWPQRLMVTDAATSKSFASVMMASTAQTAHQRRVSRASARRDRVKQRGREQTSARSKRPRRGLKATAADGAETDRTRGIPERRENPRNMIVPVFMRRRRNRARPTRRCPRPGSGPPPAAAGRCGDRIGRHKDVRDKVNHKIENVGPTSPAAPRQRPAAARSGHPARRSPAQPKPRKHRAQCSRTASNSAIRATPAPIGRENMHRKCGRPRAGRCWRRTADLSVHLPVLSRNRLDSHPRLARSPRKIGGNLGSPMRA